jgi:hypothetical protein
MSKKSFKMSEKYKLVHADTRLRILMPLSPSLWMLFSTLNLTMATMSRNMVLYTCKRRAPKIIKELYRCLLFIRINHTVHIKAKYVYTTALFPQNLNPWGSRTRILCSSGRWHDHFTTAWIHTFLFLRLSASGGYFFTTRASLSFGTDNQLL